MTEYSSYYELTGAGGSGALLTVASYMFSMRGKSPFSGPVILARNSDERQYCEWSLGSFGNL